jgi:hypothetical protein
MESILFMCCHMEKPFEDIVFLFCFFIWDMPTRDFRCGLDTTIFIWLVDWRLASSYWVFLWCLKKPNHAQELGKWFSFYYCVCAKVFLSILVGMQWMIICITNRHVKTNSWWYAISRNSSPLPLHVCHFCLCRPICNHREMYAEPRKQNMYILIVSSQLLLHF